MHSQEVFNLILPQPLDIYRLSQEDDYLAGPELCVASFQLKLSIILSNTAGSKIPLPNRTMSSGCFGIVKNTSSLGVLPSRLIYFALYPFILLLLVNSVIEKTPLRPENCFHQFETSSFLGFNRYDASISMSAIFVMLKRTFSCGFIFAQITATASVGSFGNDVTGSDCGYKKLNGYTFPFHNFHSSFAWAVNFPSRTIGVGSADGVA